MMEGSVVTVTAKGGDNTVAGAQDKGKRLGPGGESHLWPKGRLTGILQVLERPPIT